MPTQRRALVTGAAGFVGGWLVRALAADGWAVAGTGTVRPVGDGDEAFRPAAWYAGVVRDPEHLAGALDALPPGRHAFELRHPSWYCEPVYDLLREAGAALAIGDDPRRPWIDDVVLTADWTFLRFHYGREGERGDDAEAELRGWAARIGALRREAEVFAYFNNDWEAFAPANADRLLELLERR